MRSLIVATAALFGLAALPALAQAPLDPVTGARPGHQPGVGESLPLSSKASNIDSSNTHSDIAPTLPSPALADDADPGAFLRAARASLAAGKTGEAQQALEMAETRALDRAVAPSKAGVPDASPMVARIREARAALATGNRQHATDLIDQALAS